MFFFYSDLLLYVAWFPVKLWFTFHPGNATITTVGHFCSALCQSLLNKILGDCWSFSIWNMTINIFNCSGHENFESDQAFECTTCSPSLNFSGCHPDDIKENKEFFIANLVIVILIGAPANLVTLMALPYVRLRWRAKLYYTPFWDKFRMNINYFGMYPKHRKKFGMDPNFPHPNHPSLAIFGHIPHSKPNWKTCVWVKYQSICLQWKFIWL